jgi:hypothetical protein
LPDGTIEKSTENEAWVGRSIHGLNDYSLRVDPTIPSDPNAKPKPKKKVEPDDEDEDDDVNDDD